MSLLSYKHGSSPKIELKSKECIDLVLQPLKYHVTIKAVSYTHLTLPTKRIV